MRHTEQIRTPLLAWIVWKIAGALAAIPLGWQLREWLRSTRYLKRPMKKAMVYGGMAIALVPAAPALLLVSAVPGQAQSSNGNGRAPAPGSQQQLGELVQAWIDTGAACPE